MFFLETNILLFEKITFKIIRYKSVYFCEKKRKLYEKHVFIASSGFQS
jgi:hypothetical protein